MYTLQTCDFDRFSSFILTEPVSGEECHRRGLRQSFQHLAVDVIAGTHLAIATAPVESLHGCSLKRFALDNSEHALSSNRIRSPDRAKR